MLNEVFLLELDEAVPGARVTGEVAVALVGVRSRDCPSRDQGCEATAARRDTGVFGWVPQLLGWYASCDSGRSGRRLGAALARQTGTARGRAVDRGCQFAGVSRTNRTLNPMASGMLRSGRRLRWLSSGGRPAACGGRPRESGRVLGTGRNPESRAMEFGSRGIAWTLPACCRISAQRSPGRKRNVNGLLAVMDEPQ